MGSAPSEHQPDTSFTHYQRKPVRQCYVPRVYQRYLFPSNPHRGLPLPALRFMLSCRPFPPLACSALDPSIRDTWADHMVSLLSPGGELVTLIFPIVEKVCFISCWYTVYEEIIETSLGLQREKKCRQQYDDCTASKVFPPC